MDDMKAAASKNFTFGVHVRYPCNSPMLPGGDCRELNPDPEVGPTCCRP